jgi:hypothetical protein
MKVSTDRYHGSATRAFFYRLFNPLGKRLRAIGRRISGNRDKLMPAEIAGLLARSESLVDEENWTAALACAREAAALAREHGGQRARWEAGGALIRLGDCREGLQLMAQRIPPGANVGKEWRGEDLRGKVLVVLQRTKSDMGTPVRMARFVALAIERARHCVVVVERRLVPIFERSFPGAKVTAMEAGAASGAVRGDFAIGFEGLAAHFVTDWESVGAAMTPLRPDPAAVAAFRHAYRRDDRLPVVGLSWGSKNGRKDLPDLATWAQFIAAFPAIFVSMQYGEISAALRRLRGGHAEKLVFDPSVDQLADMDRFAAQVASFDAVITIDNTAAHLAGALDVPSVIIRDDRFGELPLIGDGSGWYPRSVMVRRRGRDWRAVMDEAAARLGEMLALRPAVSRLGAK